MVARVGLPGELFADFSSWRTYMSYTGSTTPAKAAARRAPTLERAHGS